MARPPKPRFYALIWGQFMGLLIVVGGMIFHWCGFGDAKVPATITARVISICVLMLISIIVPLFVNSFGSIVEGLKDKEPEESQRQDSERIASNPKIVRTLLWSYIYGDFILLTYLVHITGGITGSMFAGIYLMLPSVPLILRFTQSDVNNARYLAVACGIGILLSFFMSHYHHYEYNASVYEHAFDLALTLVTLLALSLPIVELYIVKDVEKPAQGG